MRNDYREEMENACMGPRDHKSFGGAIKGPLNFVKNAIMKKIKPSTPTETAAKGGRIKRDMGGMMQTPATNTPVNPAIMQAIQAAVQKQMGGNPTNSTGLNPAANTGQSQSTMKKGGTAKRVCRAIGGVGKVRKDQY